MKTAEPFSEREREVVDFLLQGKSNKQIALALGISNRTVEFHLSHIYAKLQVTSRVEAILKLSDKHLVESTGQAEPHRLRESAVVTTRQSAHNGETSHPPARIPMKKAYYLIGAGLLAIALLAVFIALKKPDNSTNAPSITPSAPLPTVIAALASAPILSLPSQAPSPSPLQNSAITVSQTIDSATVDLTLKWFYIDASRVYLELLITGFPLPPGYRPTRIIDLQKITLHNKADGTSIDLDHRVNFGGGSGGSENGEDSTASAPPFNEILDVPLREPKPAISPGETYTLDVPVGGEVIDELGEDARTLPFAVFHLEAKPSAAGPMTFAVQKTAQLEDKTVTLKGLEVNPSRSTVILCVFDPGGKQWLPTVHVLYRGNIFNNFYGGLIDGSNADPSREMCYRLTYAFPFDPADDPKTQMAFWIEKLTKDQPERLPNELIAAAMRTLSAQGIAFEYVIKDHGANIVITQKPAGMTEIEALNRTQKALTEEATATDVTILNLP